MLDVKVILGNNIKKLREKLNLSQESFSEKIKISPNALSTLENCKGFTTSETINNICNVFSIPASALFEMDSKYIITNHGNRKETVNDIILMLNSLDDDKLILTANFIQMIGERIVPTSIKQKL